MTQEDRELLLKDLSARFPYGVICKVEFKDSEGWKAQNMSLKGVFINECYFTTDIGSLYSKEFKPYLRPMSSMTKEEKKELERLIYEKLNRNTSQEEDEWTPWILHDTTGIRNSVGGERFYFDDMSFVYDWLNSHHFDYRGLIDRGLAHEALEGMYI
jgi:hypothetical protein